MMNEYLSLVADTLLFLKDDRIVTKPISLPIVEKKIIAKPVAEVVQPTPAPVPVKKPTSSIFEKIEKHLPHLKLIQHIPEMKQVALVVSQPQDPFIKGLKEAIEKRFYPVKIIPLDHQDWDQFELVISEAQVPAKRLIILASIASYQNNTEQKKQLWSAICHYLSPKSS